MFSSHDHVFTRIATSVLTAAANAAPVQTGPVPGAVITSTSGLNANPATRTIDRTRLLKAAGLI